MRDALMEHATPLTLEDFQYYFHAKRLGNLSFPNGQAYRHPGGMFFVCEAICPFYIALHELYQLVYHWEINHQQVAFDNIIAVIAFGSAVRFPGTVTKTRTRFWTRKPYQIDVPLQPHDADFLVITQTDLMQETVLMPLTQQTYDCGTWVKKGGIHLVNRGRQQVLNGIATGDDSISLSGLADGVPLFTTPAFPALSVEAGVVSTTPRQVFWQENIHGWLSGRIA